MKGSFYCLAAMAMLGTLMASCQKDENAGLSKVTFTATTEADNSKTHLDGVALKWNEEDAILVSNGTTTAIYTATAITRDSTCATFACGEGQDVIGENYCVYYPATAYDNGNFSLPAVQVYDAEGGMEEFPMYAYTESHAFQFDNLCGIFRLQLKKQDVSIRSISITTDMAVNGSFAVNTNSSGKHQLSAVAINEEGQKTVTLNCGEDGVSINSLTDFNIYLPTGEYGTFTITITSTDGRQCVKSLSDNTLAINRNERVTLIRQDEQLQFAPPVDFVNGLFTIDAQGTQVYFSKGNLDYNGNYFFAENQYDYGGYFGWGTGNNPTLISENPNDYATFYDWGSYVDSNWYTLSNNQWNYVLGRCNWAYCGTATVCGVHGIIILPDAWDFTTMPFNAGNIYFQPGWDANEYDATTTPTWTQMEAAGAVFLPAAGNRFGTTMFNVGNSGHYWTSSSYRLNGYAMDANFDESDVYFSNSMGCFGNSVRLVKNAE